MNKEAAMAFKVNTDAGEELTGEMIGALNTNQSVRHVWVFGGRVEEKGSGAGVETRGASE